MLIRLLLVSTCPTGKSVTDVFSVILVSVPSAKLELSAVVRLSFAAIGTDLPATFVHVVPFHVHVSFEPVFGVRTSSCATPSHASAPPSVAGGDVPGGTTDVQLLPFQSHVRGVAPGSVMWLRRRVVREPPRSRQDRFEWLEPPDFAGSITVAGIAAAPTPQARTVRAKDYVRNVWDVWSAKHGDIVASWYDRFVVPD